MANMLRTGVEWLKGQLQSNASETIVYSRGALSFTCLATPGRKLLKVSDGQGNTRVEVTDADFIIRGSDLILEGEAIEPERGDRILLEADDVDSLYEVLPYGDEPPFRWCDPMRLLCRIHTKLIEQAPHPGVAPSPAAPPAPLSVSPATGHLTTTTAVTVTGAGFVAGAIVTFGGLAATSVVVVNSTTITCLAPAHAAGAVNVVVTNPDGQTGTLVGGFTYVFSPVDVAGLVSWLKADAGTYQDSARTVPAVADGDPVGGWADQSGVGNHAGQATGSRRFTLKLAQQAGLPALLADGVDDYLLASYVATYAQAGSTIYLVHRTPATPSSASFAFEARRSTDGVPILASWYNGTGTNLKGRSRQDGGSGIADTAGLATDTSWTVSEWHWDGTTLSLAQDGGTPATVGQTGIITVNGLSLACSGVASGGAANSFLNFYLGEFLHYNVAVAPADRTALRAYLKAKWATP